MLKTDKREEKDQTYYLGFGNTKQRLENEPWERAHTHTDTHIHRILDFVFSFIWLNQEI